MQRQRLASRIHRGALCAALLFATAGCDDEDSVTEPAAIDQAVAFVGGADALRSLEGFTVTSTGSRAIAGEGAVPGGPAIDASTFKATVSYDLASDNLRIDYQRSIGFLGGLTLTFSEIYQGNLGYIEGNDSLFFGGNTAMLSSRWASGRKQQELLNPHILLREYLADASRARDLGQKVEGGVEYTLVELEDEISPIQLWVAKGGSIARATTLVNDLLHRDEPLEVTYDNWKSFDAGPRFPARVSIKLGSDVLHVEDRTVVTDPELASALFAIPADADPVPVFDAALARYGEESHQFFQEFASIGITADAPQNTVVENMLAPGVYFLTGAAHNSLVIEQTGGLVVAEAPFSPERGDAILAWAKDRFPAKPVKYVIATHHHADHAAGLRSFVAAGATVILHEASKAYMAGVFSAPSTLVPDSLSRAPVAPDIMTVANDRSVTLPDESLPVTVLPVTNTHASDMLMLLVPQTGGGYLFESDLYAPGNGGTSLNPAFPRELLDAIDQLPDGSVTTVVGGHSGVAGVEELRAYVASH